jgi:hypothetical protein
MVVMEGFEPPILAAMVSKTIVYAKFHHMTMVAMKGLEPPILSAADFKSAMYTNSITSPY